MEFLGLHSLRTQHDGHGGDSPSLFSSNEEHSAGAPVDPSADVDPSKPPHFLGGAPNGSGYHSSQYHQGYHANNNSSSTDQQSLEQSSEWTKNDMIMAVALPIILTILFAFSLRHCYIVNRRQAEFHERRQSLRAAARTQTRELRKLKEKQMKDRLKEIEKALITKTACKCKCSYTSSSTKIKSNGSILDLTSHTNITDDMDDLSRSSSRSSHDEENPASESSSSIGEESSTCEQTCAICLEPYVGGKDKVSWSKYQTCCHAFHSKCIEGWLAETKNRAGNCPICRGPYLKLNTDEDVHADDMDSYVVVEDRLTAYATEIANAIAQIRGGFNRSDTTTSDEGHNVEGHIAEVSGQEMAVISTLSRSDGNATTSENVQTSDIESDMDGAIYGPLFTDTSDAKSNIAGAVSEVSSEDNTAVAARSSPHEQNTSPIDAENATSSITKKAAMVSEFTSFCVIHGLRREKNRTKCVFLAKPIVGDNPANKVWENV